MTNQLEEFIKEFSFNMGNNPLVQVNDLREFFKNKVIIDKHEGFKDMYCAKCRKVILTDIWRSCDIHSIRFCLECVCPKCEEDKQKALKGN